MATAVDHYLNDHIGGATMGSLLAAHLLRRSRGTPLEPVLAVVAPQIEEDRRTLATLMATVGTPRNRLKEATARAAHKASLAKFAGLTSAKPDLGLFLGLEALMLGVQGKLAMWLALREVADAQPALGTVDLEDLIARAVAQRDALEAEREAAARRVLSRAGRAGSAARP
jgi:hypothetical protein